MAVARAVAVLKTVARSMVRAVAKTMATIAMAWEEIQQSTKKGMTETAMAKEMAIHCHCHRRHRHRPYPLWLP